MLEPSELFPEVPNLYEFMSVHADMLHDDVRVGKYASAIKKCVKPGDVVADIGTGTGLLAFLCLKAGAKRVHAIERSPAIKWAKLLADRHGFSERIVFHESDSRCTDLPEKVDLVTGELIGHVAFEEGMVESFFDAKERFLVSGGQLMPCSVELRVALVHEKAVYPECIDCWGQVAGIDYTPLREEAVKACYLTGLTDQDLMSEPAKFFRVDFRKDEWPQLTNARRLTAYRAGQVNGIALWFDAALAPGISLSSGPWTRTHWQQCFAPIAEPISVAAGDVLTVQLSMKLRREPGDSFEFKADVVKAG